MKLVYLANSVVPSRAANSIQVMKMCEAFATNGHDVTLLTPAHDDEASGVDDVYEYYGVDRCFDVEKLPRPNVSSLGTFLVNCQIGRRAARMDPDLAFGRSVIACYVASRSGVPTAFEAHAPMYQGRFGRVRERFFRHLSQHSSFERLVVISESLRAYYTETYPHLTDDDVLVARDGANEVSDDVDPVALETAADRLQVGYVGHLYQGRGMDVIASLAERVSGIDVHVVGGTPEDIEYWESELAHLDNVTLYGFVPPTDLDRYRLAFDVQIAPYQRDLATQAGYNTVQWMSPLKIFEYMSAGRAILASALPAIEEILEDGETALLCDPEDTAEWIDALERLRGDPALRAELGDRAKARFEADFTWETRAESVLQQSRPLVEA